MIHYVTLHYIITVTLLHYSHPTRPHPPTYILSELYPRLLQAAPGGPLTDLLHPEDTAPVTLELADFTGKAMPGNTVQGFTAHITVGGTRVGACKPTVLPLQVL